MNKINLNFQELIIDRFSYDKDSLNRTTKIYEMPKSYKNFYKQNGVCPFCNENIPKVFDEFAIQSIHDRTLTIWECD